MLGHVIVTALSSLQCCFKGPRRKNHRFFDLSVLKTQLILAKRFFFFVDSEHGPESDNFLRALIAAIIAEITAWAMGAIVEVDFQLLFTGCAGASGFHNHVVPEELKTTTIAVRDEQVAQTQLSSGSSQLAIIQSDHLCVSNSMLTFQKSSKQHQLQTHEWSATPYYPLGQI